MRVPVSHTGASASGWKQSGWLWAVLPAHLLPGWRTALSHAGLTWGLLCSQASAQQQAGHTSPCPLLADRISVAVHGAAPCLTVKPQPPWVQS